MFYIVIQFNVIQHKLRKNTQNVLSPPRAIKLGCKWPYLTTQWYTLVLLSDICHGYEREEEGGVGLLVLSVGFGENILHGFVFSGSFWCCCLGPWPVPRCPGQRWPGWPNGPSAPTSSWWPPGKGYHGQSLGRTLSSSTCPLVRPLICSTGRVETRHICCSTGRWCLDSRHLCSTRR